MDRRRFIACSAALAAALPGKAAWAEDKWGADRGYPTGWGGSLGGNPLYRVGNYSGGFEQMYPHHVIRASAAPLPLDPAPVKDLKYRWAFSSKTPDDYLDSWTSTGLLIARDGHILWEGYRRGRTAEMRLTSWSMAKSITSLLLGICLDRRLIESYDDVAEKYAPELKGTLHGQVTLRNLSNMSSGAEVVHDRDNATIYPSAFLAKDSSIARTVAGWNRRREEQGRRYNYNELCALTLGMVIRHATGQSLSAFAETNLWQPLGAQSQATWTTDSEKNEFNCVGFAATLRDWARVGTLIANRGRAGGVQVVGESWINEFTSWGKPDQQVRHGVAGSWFGYKAHMWHRRADGTMPFFNGHHGQRVIVDMKTRTVLAHTAVDHEGNWQMELFELFDAATRL